MQFRYIEVVQLVLNWLDNLLSLFFSTFKQQGMVDRYFAKIKQFCGFRIVHRAGSEMCQSQDQLSCPFYVDGKSFGQVVRRHLQTNLNSTFLPLLHFLIWQIWREKNILKLSSADWNDDLPGHQRQPWGEGGGWGGDVEHENSNKEEEVQEFLRVWRFWIDRGKHITHIKDFYMSHAMMRTLWQSGDKVGNQVAAAPFLAA